MSAKQVLDTCVEFCREHSEILIIVGVVLIGLIIVIAIVRAKQDDNDEDFSFDEKDFIKQTEEKLNEEAPTIEEEHRSKKDEANIDEKKAVSAKLDSGYIESIFGELSGFPAENLEEVEIKIHGAELKLRYTAPLNGICKEVKAKEKEIHVIKTESEETEKKSIIDEKNESDCDDNAKCDIFAEEINDHAVDNDDDGRDETATVKKFGPENYGTSRSGRVFTEEELEEQIRD